MTENEYITKLFHKWLESININPNELDSEYELSLMAYIAGYREATSSAW